MYDSLLPLLLTLAAGYLWRRLSPGGMTATELRGALNALVTYLLAPALILDVLLGTPLDLTLLLIPLIGALCVTASFLVSYGLFAGLGGQTHLPRARIGALLLATSFGNGLGIALPTVRGVLGQSAARVPTIYDVLLTIPVVWTLGVFIAARFGSVPGQSRPGAELLRLPPFWVLAAVLVINTLAVEIPPGLLRAINLLSDATVPLLVLLVGLTLTLPERGQLALACAAALLKIVLPTGLLWGLAHSGVIGLPPAVLSPLFLTVAAPSVIVGIVLCDRYRLDAELFCATLTLSTLLYVLVTPLLLQLS